MTVSAADEYIFRNEKTVISDRASLDMLQLNLLRELTEYCRHKSSFYKYLPEKLSGFSDFRKIRFMTEKDLSESAGRLMLISQSQAARAVSDMTSGTLGAPKRLYYTHQDQLRTIGFFACGLSELIGKGDRTLICMSSQSPGSIGDLIAQALKTLGAEPFFSESAGTFKQTAEAIKKYDINTMVALPLPLLSLARYMKACGMSADIKNVLVSADACSAQTEKLISEELGCGVFPHYGSRESGFGGAVTCCAHEGMHIWENELFFEIADEDGNILDDGQEGELILTTLKRRAMPLIRYRTGDTAMIYPKPCSCGSIVKRIGNIRRKKTAAADINETDRIVFSDKNVIDCLSRMNGSSLCLDITVSSEDFRTDEMTKKLAGAVPEGTGISVSSRLYEPETERPLYPYKRIILSE